MTNEFQSRPARTETPAARPASLQKTCRPYALQNGLMSAGSAGAADIPGAPAPGSPLRFSPARIIMILFPMKARK